MSERTERYRPAMVRMGIENLFRALVCAPLPSLGQFPISNDDIEAGKDGSGVDILQHCLDQMDTLKSAMQGWQNDVVNFGESETTESQARALWAAICLFRNSISVSGFEFGIFPIREYIRWMRPRDPAIES